MSFGNALARSGYWLLEILQATQRRDPIKAATDAACSHWDGEHLMLNIHKLLSQ